MEDFMSAVAVRNHDQRSIGGQELYQPPRCAGTRLLLLLVLPPSSPLPYLKASWAKVDVSDDFAFPAPYIQKADHVPRENSRDRLVCGDRASLGLGFDMKETSQFGPALTPTR